MRIRNALCHGLACLLLMPSLNAFGQEYSLTDAISGNTIPLVIHPNDIPDDFRAVKITLSGSGEGGVASMMPSLMAVGEANNMGAPASMFLEILPVSWTKGQIVSVVGQQYVVTYGLELSPSMLKIMSAAKKLPSFNLRLKLIKTSDIGSIMPLQEWTKAKYLRAVAQVANTRTETRVASNIGSVSVPAPTALPGEPAPLKTTVDTTPKPTGNNTNPTEGQASVVKGVSAERPKTDPLLYDSAQQNAKSVASAMLLYAQDYDQTFPYVQGSKGANFVIYPYVKNIGVYKTLNPMRSGEFRFNMCLAGAQMADVTEPSSTPLYYDPFAWPNGTYLVAFADSHVKFLTSDEWAAIKKNLNLKLKRRGNPLPASYALPENVGGTPTNTTTPTGGTIKTGGG